LEASLSGFLVDLGLISVDMKRLKVGLAVRLGFIAVNMDYFQEQSVVINQQLHNRQRVR
jgi:hypothetical protein